MKLNITNVNGRTLRSMRMRRGVKQSHLAELMNVSQSTISRWERGLLPLMDEELDLIQCMLAKTSVPAQDWALRRLVESSSLRVHLVCDRTHRLLAASKPRYAEWRADATDLMDRSLLCFASPQIFEAEASLARRGWYDGRLIALAVKTGPNCDPLVPIPPGRFLWERLILADGTAARLVTTIV